MLYSKQSVYYNKTTIDRRVHNSNMANDITDLQTNDRITKFQDQLKNEYVYRITLRYATVLGKIKFPLKVDSRIRCHLETVMKKLFDSIQKVTMIVAPDVQIIFRPSFIQYEQFKLHKNFRQYLETIMLSKKILRRGAQNTPIRKTYKTSIGSDSISVEFLGCNIQIEWLEISLVYDKSDKHTAIYDSYIVELAAKYIK